MRQEFQQNWSGQPIEAVYLHVKNHFQEDQKQKQKNISIVMS